MGRMPSRPGARSAGLPGIPGDFAAVDGAQSKHLNNRGKDVAPTSSLAGYAAFNANCTDGSFTPSTCPIWIRLWPLLCIRRARFSSRIPSGTGNESKRACRHFRHIPKLSAGSPNSRPATVPISWSHHAHICVTVGMWAFFGFGGEIPEPSCVVV